MKIAAEPASFYSSLLERLESENGIEDTFAAVVDRERMFADEVQLFAVSVGPGFLVGKCSKLIVPIRHTVAVVMNFTPEFSSNFTLISRDRKNSEVEAASDWAIVINMTVSDQIM